MQRRNKFLIGVMVVLASIIGVTLWTWTPAFDLKKVDSTVAELALPLRAADAEKFLDGGSIGITLTDANGVVLRCWLPVENHTDPPTWPQVFVGLTKFEDVKSVDSESRKADDPVATRAYLMRLLDRYGTDRGERVLVLLELRGAPRDKLRAFLHE